VGGVIWQHETLPDGVVSEKVKIKEKVLKTTLCLFSRKEEFPAKEAFWVEHAIFL
jgi:hypothetical protein